MKITINTSVLFLFAFLCCGSISAQTTRMELGDKYFSQFAYKAAIRMYEGAEKRGENNWRVYAKLGDCYFNTSRPATAASYYKQAIGNNGNIGPGYLLNYALSLQSSGAPDKEVLDAFRAYYDKIGKEYIEGRRIVVDTSEYELENLASINTKNSDFGTFIKNDTLYFSSSRENPDRKRRINKRLYKWNEQPFLDIYSAEIVENSDSLLLKFIPPDSSNIAVNTYAHESVISISNDGFLYYSGGDVNNKGQISYNRNGTSVIKVRRASKVEGKWQETRADKEAMEFLDFELYSMSSPALYYEKNILFFTSCAPFREARGKTDIYYTNLDPTSTEYQKIKSVPGINTSGRESFPFISSDGTLYFSSDGIYDNRLSLGLLDIYKVENILDVIDGEATAGIKHLGAPFNSDKDDFAFYLDETNSSMNCERYAYFSSNRDIDGAKGDDDIYRYKMKINKTVSGEITDSSTGETIEDAEVHLIDVDGKVLKTVQTDANGTYSFEVDCDAFYRIRADKTYFDGTIADYKSDSDVNEVNLAINPYPCEISKQIGFEYNSAELTFDAKVDLLQILEILLADEGVQIIIESHTDLRGSDDYNQELSERRAKSTRDYLVESGVKGSQIIAAIGHGEKCPLITEETILNLPESEREDQHAKNRRSRFILSICKDNIDRCNQQGGLNQSN